MGFTADADECSLNITAVCGAGQEMMEDAERGEDEQGERRRWVNGTSCDEVEEESIIFGMRRRKV